VGLPWGVGRSARSFKREMWGGGRGKSEVRLGDFDEGGRRREKNSCKCLTRDGTFERCSYYSLSLIYFILFYFFERELQMSHGRRDIEKVPANSLFNF
jgi:hypothetical protein